MKIKPQQKKRRKNMKTKFSLHRKKKQQHET